RTTRALSLTPEGEKLYAAAREVVSAAERGLDGAIAASAVPSGTLRITAPAMLAETRFCKDLALFLEAHPRVSIAIGFTEQRRDLVRDGLDLALRIGRLEDSELKARRLAVMPRVLVGAREYVAAREVPNDLADLADWDHVQLSPLRPVL